MSSFDPVTARLILVLAEEGSIGRAAEKEHIAASAVSRRLSDLEARLGVALFDRSAQGVRPTIAGDAYLERTRRVMREIADLDLVMGEHAAGKCGSLRLACTSAALSGRLPELLARFAERYPDVAIDLRESSAAAGLSALEDGLADVAVVSDNYDFSRFETRPFEDDRVWVIAPPEHPLAALLSPARPVAFADVVAHESVGVHHSGALDRLLNEHAAKLGHVIGARLRVESFAALVRLVEAGFGIGFLRATSLHLLAGTDLVCAPLSNEWAHRKLLLARRRSGPTSRAIADFIALCDATYVPSRT
ncbi:LysR family transcriptional regulator [Devosia pacifica]|uniref:LysR family transcriptional regulator n=1 Tax=Devosia pacifica TaxID=1335967 RepID=UPI00167AAEE3|nr:LysR substrate-binding domain-containing protein [Devosia pacifica]